jgi:hypothetical protein
MLTPRPYVLAREIFGLAGLCATIVVALLLPVLA